MSKMIIFSCTNRTNSYTLKVSKIYQSILKSKNVESSIFSFENLPESLAFSETFGKRSQEFEQIIEKNIRGFNSFIFVIPEYNGGFPGILKTFLDAVPPKEWQNKKICFVGVSTGRAGNIRGMEHLTGIMNYLKSNVFYNKLPISQVDKLMNESGEFSSEEQALICDMQVRSFLEF